MILRLQVSYCLVNIAAGKPWCLYFQRYHIGILAVKPDVYIFPLKPSIHLFDIPLSPQVSAAARAIVVSDEKADSMRVTWQRAPGNVVNYRVTYRPKAGGRQLATKVAGSKITTMLRNLTSLTTYEITVLPIYRSGEGKAREGEGTTCTSVFPFLLPNSPSPYFNDLPLNISLLITCLTLKDLKCFKIIQFSLFHSDALQESQKPQDLRAIQDQLPRHLGRCSWWRSGLQGHFPPC